jgi:hypothetical protein
MTTKLQEKFEKFYREERRRVLRSWCFGLGVFILCVGLLTIFNPLANPKSWTSTYSFFVAVGSLYHYALWLILIGFILVLIAMVIS